MHMNRRRHQCMLDQAQSHVDEEKYLHAMQIYRRLIQNDPNCSQPYIELSSLFVRSGHLLEAANLLRQAQILDSENDEISFFLGNVYLQLGEYDQSLSCYNMLTDKKYSEVHFNMGVAYYYKNDLKKAEEQFWLAMEYDPQIPGVDKFLGELLINRRAYAEAIQVLSRGVASDPYSASNHQLLGIVYSRLSKWNKAYNEFAMAIDRDPMEPVNWLMCGESLIHMNRVEEAERYLRKSYELQPHSIDTIVALSHVHSVKGDTKVAQIYLDQALKLDPGYILAGEVRERHEKTPTISKSPLS